MSLITIPVIENSIYISNFIECNCCMENKKYQRYSNLLQKS